MTALPPPGQEPRVHPGEGLHGPGSQAPGAAHALPPRGAQACAPRVGGCCSLCRADTGKAQGGALRATPQLGQARPRTA